jgi:hypothetical protein
VSRFTEATFEVTARKQRGRVVVRLTSPFAYEVGYRGSGWTLWARAGFETDFASIPVLPSWTPRWIRRARDWTADKLARSAVAHDLCRLDPRVPKLTGDLIFLEAMGVDRVPLPLRLVAFAAVLLNFSRH